MAEQLGAQVGPGMLAQVIGSELNVPDLRRILVEIDVFVAATVHVIKNETGDALLRPDSQFSDGRILGIE